MTCPVIHSLLSEQSQAISRAASSGCPSGPADFRLRVPVFRDPAGVRCRDEIVFTVIPRSISSSDSVNVTWVQGALGGCVRHLRSHGRYVLAGCEQHHAASGPAVVLVGEFLDEQQRRPDVDLQLGVDVISRELCQGALLERMVDDEDVDVTERVLRRTDDGRRSRGIREIGLDMRHRAACLLQLGEHCRQPARVRSRSPAAHEWMRTPLPAASSLRATAKPIPFLRLTPVTTAVLDTPRIYCPCE